MSNRQSTSEQYDAIIIGAGQAGGPLSTALAKAGKRTALIERAYVGGSCINYGCTPTKTMVASGRVAYLARRSADYGVHTSKVTVNMEEIRARKRKIVEEFRKGSQSSIEETEGVDLIFGEASFTSDHQISIALNEGGTRQIHASQIFINTGTSPRIPDIEGIDDVPFLTNVSVMELAEVPDHLLVLGGGYIGVEFAQMFRRFGADVTIIQRGGQLLSREDADVAETVQEILTEDGIQILLDSEAKHVRQENQQIQLTVQTKQGEQTLTGSHLLVAAGRQPNTHVLNLDAAGIQTDEHGYIQVNAKLETNIAGIYALGDVKGGPAFTHISYDDFRVLRTNLIEGGQDSIEGRMVPYCIFMDPELAHVGISEQAAKEQGLPVRVATMPMKRVARAQEMDETRGLMKIIVNTETKQILGFTMLGLWAGEIMSLVQVAMMGKLTYPALDAAIFAHPTLAEAVNNLVSQIES